MTLAYLAVACVVLGFVLRGSIGCPGVTVVEGVVGAVFIAAGWPVYLALAATWLATEEPGEEPDAAADFSPNLPIEPPRPSVDLIPRLPRDEPDVPTAVEVRPGLYVIKGIRSIFHDVPRGRRPS